jgi:hypothetical protein
VKTLVPPLCVWASCVHEENVAALGAVVHFMASYYDLSEGSVLSTGHVVVTEDSPSIAAASIPLSVLASNAASRAKVSTWLCDVVLRLLWAESIPVLTHMLQDPSGDVCSVESAVTAIMRLTLSVFCMVPACPALMTIVQSRESVFLSFLQSGLSHLSRVWQYSTSPILFIAMNEVWA